MQTEVPEKCSVSMQTKPTCESSVPVQTDPTEESMMDLGTRVVFVVVIVLIFVC